MISELSAWSGRCDSVLTSLEMEIEKVKSDAKKRAAREAKAEAQVKSVTEAGEKGSGGSGGSKAGPNARGSKMKDEGIVDDDDNEDDDDAMDVEPSGPGGGSKKKGGMGGVFGRLSGKGAAR